MKAKRISGLLLAGLAAVTLASCNGEEAMWTGIGRDHVIASPATDAREVSLAKINNQTKNAQKLALLEKYALENRTYGYTIYQTAGYTKFKQDRFVFPTNDKGGKPVKIKGYGFGADQEGVIQGVTRTGALAKYSGYATSYGDRDEIRKSTVNTWNEKTSGVSNNFYTVHAQAYEDRLVWDETENRIVKEKIAVLVDGAAQSKVNVETDPNPRKQAEKKIRPIALTKDGKVKTDYKSGDTNKKWRIYLKTTKNTPNLKYTFNDESYTKDKDGKEIKGIFDVKAEDYLTSFKYVQLGSAPVERSQEGINSSSEIAGMKQYYNETKDKAKEVGAGTTDEQVTKLNEIFGQKFTGVKLDSDENGDFIDIEFVKEITSFYALYYTNLVPIPQKFIQHIGGLENYGTKANNRTIQQNLAQTGPFNLVEWNDKDSYIAFERNEVLTGKDGIYGKNGLKEAIDGGKYTNTKFGKLNEALKEYRYQGVKGQFIRGLDISKDPDKAWNEFSKTKDQELDYVGIPHTQKAHFQDADVIQSEGSSNERLNVNTLDQDTWDHLFGKNGILSTSQTQYQVKPILNNKDFTKAIDFLIDRKSVIESNGVKGSIDFFADAYIIDPENNMDRGYSETMEHKKVLTDYYGGEEIVETLKKGEKVKTKANELLLKAAKKLIDDKKYNEGDKIDLTIQIRSEREKDAWVKKIAEGLTKDVNEGLKEGTKQLLTVNFVVQDAPTDFMDTYRNMQTGRYDFSTGSISGSTLDPISFMSVLSSNSRDGFTLDYSRDTNLIDLDKDGKIVAGTYIDITELVKDDAALANVPKYWSYDAFYEAAQGKALIKIREAKDAAGNKVKIAEQTFHTDAGRLDNIVRYDAGAVLLINYAAINSDPAKGGTEKHIATLKDKIIMEIGEQKLELKWFHLDEYKKEERPEWLPESVNVEEIQARENVKNIQPDTKIVFIFLSKDDMAKVEWKSGKIVLAFDYKHVVEGKEVTEELKEFVVESFN